jgi:ribosomal protein S18 acetylase RimI-like enzyme
MLKYRLRAAELPDLAHCLEIDASYVTTHVWQMEERFERLEIEDLPSARHPAPKNRAKMVGKAAPPPPQEFHTAFRPSRLPRPVAVPAPWGEQQLLAEWKKTDFLAVAESLPEVTVTDEGEESTRQPEILGYVGLTVDLSRHLAWVSSQAVQLDLRRKGIGSALLKEAKQWADRNRLRSLMCEVQTKNYPGIQFLQKNNFFFCGYNSAYYPTREIALFFGLRLESPV